MILLFQFVVFRFAVSGCVPDLRCGLCSGLVLDRQQVTLPDGEKHKACKMFLYTVKNITKLAKLTTNHRSHRKHRDSMRNTGHKITGIRAIKKVTGLYLKEHSI